MCERKRPSVSEFDASDLFLYSVLFFLCCRTSYPVRMDCEDSGGGTGDTSTYQVSPSQGLYPPLLGMVGLFMLSE